ncbi:DUF1080 domain-containing protein [Muricauda sp. CAU 1633]|uniref:3-keto-disaccharide hydrolase n=1 Tax=Allomuricauda sp. CAU 1633 TaxID=2816036 RepID=UPI001A8D1CB5|nr:DUF1080 domain-containing protein [Muricauda sp. CAU 1633]MBO0324081.1 DUF1080 domain-containing protein [Muricauda sp. CAU 1633]
MWTKTRKNEFRKQMFKMLLVLLALQFMACLNKKPVQTNPEEETWVSLFNGENLEGWEMKFSGQDLNVNYKNTVRAEDGILKLSYDDYDTFGDAYGHVYYHKPFSYYKIRFDYQFVGDQIEGGTPGNNRNSGIMLHSQSAASNGMDQDFPVSIEMQFLGGLEEGKERPTGNVCTPGTAVEMNGEVNYDHCISSSSETYYGDQWISAEAIVMGGESMTFIIENDTVLAFQKPQIGGGFISKAYEGEDWDRFGVGNKEEWIAKEGKILTEGYIALQAESHPINFRNLELLNLCGCKDPKAKNYKSYYVKDDPSACEY